MEILCAGSCRGNARGMRWKGAENLFPSFFLFFLIVNRTAPGRRQRHRKPANKGGYGLRIPSTPNTPIVAASRYSPRIITDKSKKRNVSDSGNVTSAFHLPKYRGGLPLPASSAYRIFRDVYPNFLSSDYVTFLDSA